MKFSQNEANNKCVQKLKWKFVCGRSKHIWDEKIKKSSSDIWHKVANCRELVQQTAIVIIKWQEIFRNKWAFLDELNS